MKKLLALVAAAAVFTGSAFALNLGDIKGTWQDSKWNANWTFSADGKIILTDSVTGEEYFTFTDSNVTNYKLDASTSGVSISFYCKETGRAYKFTKPITLNADLDMKINPDWTDTDYDTSIKFKR